MSETDKEPQSEPVKGGGGGGGGLSGSVGGSMSKLMGAFSSMSATQDLKTSARILTDDMKAFSTYAKNKAITLNHKVKNIQDKRRQRQQLPGVTNLVHEVNQGAGAEILSHYKWQWNKIHRDTGRTSEVTEEMYQTLQKLYSDISNGHQIISFATDEFSGLPDVLKNVEETSAKVDAIEQLLRKVEDSILECIRTGEILDNERKKHSLQVQLKKHREEKERELQKWEGVVQEEKNLTLEAQVRLEQAAHRERQEALNDMFKQQMSEYKEKGSVEKPILSDDAVRDRSMSEHSVDNVEIEDSVGDEQLKEFLSDTITEETEKEKEEEKEDVIVDDAD